MHRHKIVVQISLILSILNLVLAAPIMVREIHEARDDETPVAQDVAAVPDAVASPQHSPSVGGSTASGYPTPPPDSSLAGPGSSETPPSLQHLTELPQGVPSPHTSSLGSLLPPPPPSSPQHVQEWQYLRETYVQHRPELLQGVPSPPTSSSGSSPPPSPPQLQEWQHLQEAYLRQWQQYPEWLQGVSSPHPSSSGPLLPPSPQHLQEWQYFQEMYAQGEPISPPLSSAHDSALDGSAPSHHSMPQGLAPSHHLPSDGSPPSPSPPTETSADNAGFLIRNMKKFKIVAGAVIAGGVIIGGIVGSQIKHKHHDNQDG